MTRLIFILFGLNASVIFFSATDSNEFSENHLTNSFDSTRYKAGLKLFKRNCAICHTIKKMDLVGPTLNGIEERHSRKWIIKFILDKEFRKADKSAVAVIKKYSNIEHPDYGTNLTKKEVILILDFIKVKETSNDLSISFEK